MSAHNNFVTLMDPANAPGGEARDVVPVVDPTNPNHVILVGGVVEGSIQRAVIPDGGDEQDPARGHLQHLVGEWLVQEVGAADAQVDDVDLPVCATTGLDRKRGQDVSPPSPRQAQTGTLDLCVLNRIQTAGGDMLGSGGRSARHALHTHTVEPVDVSKKCHTFRETDGHAKYRGTGVSDVKVRWSQCLSPLSSKSGESQCLSPLSAAPW